MNAKHNGLPCVWLIQGIVANMNSRLPALNYVSPHKDTLIACPM